MVAETCAQFHENTYVKPKGKHKSHAVKNRSLHESLHGFDLHKSVNNAIEIIEIIEATNSIEPKMKNFPVQTQTNPDPHLNNVEGPSIDPMSYPPIRFHQE